MAAAVINMIEPKHHKFQISAGGGIGYIPYSKTDWSTNMDSNRSPLLSPERRQSRLLAGAPALLALMLTAWLAPVEKTQAHHSHANLDRNRTELHRGTVLKYGWVMPHVYLKVKTTNSEGELVTYSIEMLHPPGMAERGWSRKTFKPGDLIVWEGAPDRRPNRYLSGLKWAEKADGTRLTLELEDEGATRLAEPSTDYSGLWSRHLDVPRRYRPPTDWPYTELGRQKVDNFDDSQNPQIDCDDPGPPKANLLPYPLKISRPGDNKIRIEYDARKLPRTVYLDKSQPPGEPSKIGHSVGWFEGDELVIETTNFVDDRWGTYTGVDSSAQKHLTERLRLSDNGLEMDMTITVIDPVYFTEPVVIEHKLRKLADRDLFQAECSRESAEMYLQAESQK